MQRKLAIFTCIITLAVLGSIAEAGTAQTLRYMPSDSEAYISVDVKKVRTTQLGRLFFRALESDRSVKRDLAKFKKASGLDFRRHISAASIFLPASLLAGKSEQFLIVAEGQFQKRRIEALIRKESKSVKVGRHAGRKLLIIDNEGALAFDGRYALLGTVPQVKSGLSNRARGGRVAPRLEKAMAGGGDAHGGIVLAMSMRQQLGRDFPQAKDLVAASATLDTGKMLSAKARLVFSNAGSARKTAQIVNGYAKQMANDRDIKKMGLDRMLASTNATVSGKVVTIKTSANTAKLIRIAQQMFNF